MDLNTDLPEKPSKDAAISLANHLLKEFRIPTQVIDTHDISSSLFVVLYESLFSDRLPGIIRQPTTRDDEIHNCQIVIDVLSTDVIHDNLSHIRGVDIVAGDMTAIFNLLDIFSHLLEYVMNKIESDHEDSRSVCSVEHVAEKITLSKKNMPVGSKKIGQVRDARAQSHSNTTNMEVKIVAGFGSQRAASLNKNENRKGYDDHRIISHEDFYAMTYGGLSNRHSIMPLSPIRHDASQSLLGQKTIDSEFDTYTEKVEQVFDPSIDHPKIAWDDKPKPSRDGHSVIDAAVATASSIDKDRPPTTTSSSSSAAATTGLSSSMPPPRQSPAAEKQDPLRSTVGTVTYHSHPTQKDESSLPEKNLLSYYSDLRHLVKKTAAMSRAALESSPSRNRADRDMVTRVVDHLQPTLTGEDVRLVQELNAGGMNKEDQYLVGGRKKVAFAASQSNLKDEQRGVTGSKYHCDQWVTDDSDQELEDGYQERDLGQRYQVGPSAGLPVDQTHQKPKSLKSKGQTKAFARHLALNRQPELGAAHMVLKNEDLAIRKKHELLRKFYEKDHEEFAENVEYMLGRDLERAAETGERFVQTCSEAAGKKKGVIKVKGTSARPVRKKSKLKLTRCQIPDKDSKALSQGTTIESEEDLLPFLMDEFPYLHLTEHTWHELWRKGLHQIEGLTRAYQDIERKKSRAQSQLTEAAERHNLLSEIMRKQLDHSRRMQEIKEQKQQQIQIRNKSHDKRIQSARARRYYNEYQVRARAKVLKRRTKEEMVFRELFKDTLTVQRERIKDIRKYASDQRKRQEQQRQNEIDSLENYYHNQFEMLADRLARERFETEVRDVAQKQMMDRMKRELRKKMESEIKQYQEQMFRNDDDAHFRQADADRVKQHLHTARYSVKI